MNCKLWHNIGCLMIIALISFSMILTVTPVNGYQSQPSTYSVAVTKTPSTSKQIQTAYNASVWFDISRFSNESHKIIVEREIGVREYGFTRDNITVMIKHNDTMFNTFNISLPSDVSASLHYYRFEDLTEPDYTPNITQISYGANFTTFTLHVADIEPGRWRNVSMIAGYADRMETNYKDLHYNYSIFFHPLLSIPVTNYSAVVWFEDEGVTPSKAIIEESLLPNVTHKFENFTVGEGPEYLGLFFENITTLPTVNLTLMDQFGYQNTTKNFTFIPAFQPNLARNLSIPLTFNFTPSSPLMECKKFVRRLEIDQWGVLRVYETMTLVNLGHKGQDDVGIATYQYDQGRFVVSEPDELIFEGATDFYGNMTVTSQTVLSVGLAINHTELLIEPRIKVTSNESYTFTIAYRLPLTSVVNTTEEGSLKLTSWICSRFNWTIRDFTLNVNFPIGAVTSPDRSEGLDSASVLNQSTELGFLNIASRTVLTAQYLNFTEFHNTGLTITYDPGFLWLFWTPATICAVLFLLGLVYLVTRTLSFTIQGVSGVAEMEIPVESIRDFIKTYEEKMALQKRIEDLDRRYSRGKIKKRRYEDDRTILMAELTKIQRQAVNFSTNLKRKGYESFMRIVENSETEREDLRANLSRLRQRYSKGTISKEQFERQQRQYQKRLQDALNRIDRTLIELRSKLEQAKSK